MSSSSTYKSFLDDNKNRNITFIHSGYPKAKELGQIVNEFDNVNKHIFLDDQILYRRQFNKNGVEKIIKLDLSEAQKVQFDKSINAVIELIEILKEKKKKI